MFRVTVATLLTASLALPACSRRDDARTRDGDAGPARPVKVVAVNEQDVHRVVDIVGTLAAVEEVIVSSEVEGKVSRTLADLGDRVVTGQVLVELDREKLRYRYEAAKAALEQARARYGVNGTGDVPRLEATPDVQKSAAELAQAEQALTRARELHRRALLSQQQLDDAEARQQVARASHGTALQSARNFRADIDGSEANMRLAERELHDASIRAPFDGYIQKRLVSPGVFVRVQTPVMSLVKVNPLKLTGEVPERMVPWITVGQTVELRVDAYPERVIAGTISRISPAVSPQTRAFALEATVPNADGLLKPGTFARTRIATGKIDRILTLPVTALQYRYGVNRVFVVTGERLTSSEVKLGDRLGDIVEVVAGVKAGDRVVVSDVDRLAEGEKVSAR